MFSSLRQNSLLYILDKNDKLTLTIGKVVDVKVPPYGSINPYVDVTIDVDGKTIELKELPSSLSTSVSKNDPNVIVSENKDDICVEVENFIKQCKYHIDRMQYYQDALTDGEEVLVQINPRMAKEKEQEQRIQNLEQKLYSLESSVGDVKTDAKDIKSMLSELLNKK